MNKFVLSKKVQEWLDATFEHHTRKNLYTCDTCRGEVVTLDVDKGVTPFMISCRATPNCKGTMQSNFYNCDPAREATYEWYRPETMDGLGQASRRHVEQGGLLLRPRILPVDKHTPI